MPEYRAQQENAEFPLSAPQASIWSEWINNPDAADFHICEFIELNGPLELVHFRAAIEQADAETDAMSLCFSTDAGRPLLTLPDKRPPFDYLLIDLGETADAEACAWRELESARRQPLDLARGNSMRHRLIRFSGQRHWWVRICHHLTSDAMSGVVMCRRVEELYNARVQGQEVTPAAFTSYREFIEEDQRYPDSRACHSAVSYWRERLQDDQPVSRFASESRQPSASQSRTSDQQLILRCPLPAARLQQLKGFAAQLGCSMSILLQAVYQLLLARENGQQHSVCYSPVMNRYGRSERAMPGLFAVSLPFPLDCQDEQSFTELVAQVSRHKKADMRHMRLAPTRMRTAGIGRGSFSRRGGAVFIANDFALSLDFHGLTTRITNAYVGAVDDVALVYLGNDMHDPDSEAMLVWVCNLSVLSAPHMQRLISRFDVLLDAAMADPHRPLRYLSVLGKAELAQIRQWEQGAAVDARLLHTLLPARIWQRTAFIPDAIAVRYAGHDYRYRWLAEKAGELAARLQQVGVGKGARVGLCTSPCAEQIAAVLAILSVGAAVMPLDPQMPAVRLVAMLSFAEADAVLVDADGQTLLQQAGWQQGLMSLEQAPESQGALTQPVTLSPDDIAFVYHTSGSTGQPKPVLIPHGALCLKTLSMAELFGYGSDEVACVATSMNFDPWMQQVMMALSQGANLWLADRLLQADPAAFWREAVTAGMTQLNMAPTQLDSLMQGEVPTAELQLRRILLGGEVLRPELANRLRLLLGAPVWNMYGPTETTVDITGIQLPELVQGELPIGRVLPGGVVRLLNAQRQRVAIGEAGEICIGGVGITAGYLAMAKANQQRFIDDPYATGATLYRSGDRGCWNEQGELLYLGRDDDQVKVRGQRIELAEVEAQLHRCQGVEQGVVWYQADAQGGSVQAAVAGQVAERELVAELSRRLPAAAVPAQYLLLERLPVMASGKIDRQRLKALLAERQQHSAQLSLQPAPVAPSAASGRRHSLEQAIGQIWAELLSQPRVDPTANLFEIGAHSLLVPRAQARISAVAGREVRAVELFHHSSVRALAAFLSGEAQEPAAPALSHTHGAASALSAKGVSANTAPVNAAEPIAVIGMGMRFPGAETREQFWQLLVNGQEAISDLTAEHFRQLGADPALLERDNFVARHGVLAGIDQFDPAPFGLSLAEAREMDPQQRLLLEVAKAALEDACCDPQRDGPVGTYVGTGFATYMLDLLSPGIRLTANADRYAVSLGNDKDYAATRLAYKLGLTGPAVAVSTACSTGLVSVALAVQALRSGQCRVALAGGASFGFSLGGGFQYVAGGIGSRSGHCRPYDQQADGTIGASGAGVVLLKRLSDAMADGDTINGVIRGIGLSNDGAAKAAFTAPSVSGQVQAIRHALQDANVAPDSIGYVEGHGTGTALGDPIEVEGLNLAYGHSEQPAWLGSVKGNLGHLDAASGIASLIKALLSLERGTVPPTCHFTVANPHIPFAEGRFRVNDQPQPWPVQQGLRRAGINNFGVGGTNVHVIVEQAPPPVAAVSNQQNGDIDHTCLLPLSAASATALTQNCLALADHLEVLVEQHKTVPALADMALSLSVRPSLSYRHSIVASDLPQAVQQLRQLATTSVSRADGHSQPLALLFPGQGAQQPGMARELYQQQPEFRQWLDQACQHLLQQPDNQHLQPLKTLLLADPDDGEAAQQLADTALTQPALFIVEYGIARLLCQWGLQPVALLGHSIGEYAAAALAGVMSATDTLDLVAARGRLMASAPAGAMLALSMAEADVQQLLAETGLSLAIAALNGPRQCVVSGSVAAMEKFEQALQQRAINGKRLAVSHGFHSAQMDAVLDAFRQRVASVQLSPPAIAIASNLTGNWLSDAEATDPDYWVRHLRGTVRYADDVACLQTLGPLQLLECGPGMTAARLAQANGVPAAQVLASQPLCSPAAQPPRRAGRAALLSAVGQLWSNGLLPDWQAVHGRQHWQRTPLPTYRYARQRCWVETPALPVDRTASVTVATSVKVANPSTLANQNNMTSPNVATRMSFWGSGVPTPAQPEIAPAVVPPLHSADADLSQQVLTIWCEMFGRDDIQAEDDFFVLGGDSLLAVRLVSRLQSELGCDISTAVMLDCQTPAALVAWLESHAIPPAVPPTPIAPVFAVPAKEPVVNQQISHREEGVL
ncbi:non-ribosomal peptide synthetase/type I polyketide synthase [Pokkaliibacter plantistimulans]|nr:non-ribosomal peptide synthetase/type I polyketide synthase [Pokkaliibacter plantistimulans]